MSKIVKVIKMKFKREESDFVVMGEDLGKKIWYPDGYNNLKKDTVLFEYINEKTETKKELISLRLLEKKDSEITPQDLYDYPLLNIFREYYNDIDDIECLKYDISEKIRIYDITDWEFNKFQKISRPQLESTGLWIQNGIRRIEFEFENRDNFNNKLFELDAKCEVNFGGYFNRKDNKDIAQIDFIGKIASDNNNDRYIFEIDTDKIGELVQDEASSLFFGDVYFKIKRTELNRSKDAVEIFYYPIKIKMVNPKIDEQSHVKDDIVSIDFGTSSTCIAYDNGKKMLSFNDSPAGDLDYENPTALSIFNWRAVYHTWRRDNNTIPHFNISKNDLDQLDELDHFDYGYGVIRNLEFASSKFAKCTITDLKSLPEKLLKEKSKEIFEPYFEGSDGVRVVNMTYDIEKENKETLNPIAFYGYLIGRSLNKQISNKIYLNYQLTMPVNFNQTKRNIILESLRYGLQRSVPYILRDELIVSEGKEESVALLGSVTAHLRPQGGKPAVFSVFDFGGGTLDFAFGILRKSEEDSDIIEHESELYSNVLEVFKTGGELVGGETLIREISYEIYKDHSDKMREENVPIYSETGKLIEHYPDALQGITQECKVNLKLINEHISRNIFKSAPYDEKKEINLLNLNGEEVFFKFLVNEDNINGFLRTKIGNLVIGFKNKMDEAFKEPRFVERLKKYGIENLDVNDVKIFQSGNTCKAKWIKEAFENVFPSHNNIIFVEDKDKGITPKNAVAKGALKLSGKFGVYNFTKQGIESNIMPLKINIGMRDDFDDAFIRLLSKGDNSIHKSWMELTKIGKEKKFDIFFTYSENVDSCDSNDVFYRSISIPEKLLKDESKRTVFIKPKDETSIQYYLGSANDKEPSPDIIEVVELT